VTATRSPQNVLAVMVMFHMLMYVVAHPELATLAGNDGGADSAMKNQWKREANGMVDRSYPKVEVFRETIRDVHGEIRAYRFFFVILDDGFDMDRGIEGLIQSNAEEAAKAALKAKPALVTDSKALARLDHQTPDKLARWCHSKDEYIDTVLRAVDPTLPRTGDAYTKTLAEGASVVTRLSLERNMEALEAMFPRVEVPYLDTDGVTVLAPLYPFAALKPEHYRLAAYRQDVVEPAPPGDEPVEYRKYAFPYGAACFRPEQQHHVVQNRMRLCDTNDMHDWKVGLRREEIHARILEAIHDARKQSGRPPLNGDPDNNLLDQVRELNMRDLQGKTPEEQYAFRKGPMAMDRFMRITHPEADIPGAHKSVFALGAKRMRAKLAVGSRTRFPLTLARWANAGARCSLASASWTRRWTRAATCSRASCSVSRRRRTCRRCTWRFCCATLRAWACSSTPTSSRCTCSSWGASVRPQHPLTLSRPGASGKSFVQTVTQRFSIEGTFEKISVKTLRSDTAEMNLNGMLVFRDEMPDSLFDANANDAEYKEAIGVGRMITRSIVVVDG